jgi:type II secretory pathway pseudopilin PulG
MSMKRVRHEGITLIELVVFIIVVAIVAVGLFKALARSLPIAPTPQQITQANQIAQERMELIVGQKDISGYLPMTDPCVGGTPPAICTPSGFTVTVCGINAGGGCASPPIACPAAIDNNTANCRSITVTVKDSTTSTQLAVLTSLVTNF